MFPSTNLPTLARRAGVVVGIAVLGISTLGALRGIPDVLHKREEIRKTTEEIADLDRKNKLLREHNQRLENSPDEQQMQIREQLKMQRPNETTFYLPDPLAAVPEKSGKDQNTPRR